MTAKTEAEILVNEATQAYIVSDPAKYGAMSVNMLLSLRNLRHGEYAKAAEFATKVLNSSQRRQAR